ncbi:uncharacterized protein VNE69_03203 [Vairimorpha necatrix]|uniref:Uncharacterized protein n=1 Tax=Vairimorpha necatrix TaxID=6039 RepID=A0AAX4JAM3_9MICR
MFLFFSILKSSNNMYNYYNTTMYQQFPNNNRPNCKDNVDLELICKEVTDEDYEDMIEYFKSEARPFPDQGTCKDMNETAKEHQIKNIINFLQSGNSLEQNDIICEFNDESTQKPMNVKDDFLKKEKNLGNNRLILPIDNENIQEREDKSKYMLKTLSNQFNMKTDKTNIYNNCKKVIYDTIDQKKNIEFNMYALLKHQLIEIENNFRIIKEKVDEKLSHKIMKVNIIGNFNIINDKIIKIRGYLSHRHIVFKKEILDRALMINKKLNKLEYLDNNIIIDAINVIINVSNFILPKITRLHLKTHSLQLKQYFDIYIWKLNFITNTCNLPEFIETIYVVFRSKIQNKSYIESHILYDLSCLKEKVSNFFSVDKEKICSRMNKICRLIAEMHN